MLDDGIPISPAFPSRETLIQSLSDFTLEFLGIARNNLTRIAGYLRKVMTKLCIKILVKSDSAIESAFPWSRRQAGNEGAKAALFRTCGSAHRRSDLFASFWAEYAGRITPLS